VVHVVSVWDLQINGQTSFLDASVVYGADEARCAEVIRRPLYVFVCGDAEAQFPNTPNRSAFRSLSG
jgi:hypothetical protein